MQIVYDGEALKDYMTHAVSASPEHPVLIDKFLDDAIEVDVDALGDGDDVVIGGIMEHIERAGVHSGDSACSLPPKSIGQDVQDEIRRHTIALAKALNVRGLMNVQFAVQGNECLCPRSQSARFAHRAFCQQSDRRAVGQDGGAHHGRRESSKSSDSRREVLPKHISVKEAVFPFNKFPGVDTLLGPEMKSTGEVMGIDDSFGIAFAKAQLGGGMRLPKAGKVFISVRDEDKASVTPIAAKTL